MNRIMVLKGGSPAIHMLGDIGREEDDFIRVLSEDNNYYIGHFEEGFGFVNVKFKKEDCRKLNEQELEKLNGCMFAINDKPLYRISLDCDGNLVPSVTE